MKMRSEFTLSEDELRAIGCVAVESAYLDGLVDIAIRELSCLDEADFRLLIGGAQFGAKLSMLQSMMKAKITPEFKAEMTEIFDDISNRMAHRNTIIHGSWGVPKLRLGVGGVKGLPIWIREGDAFAIKKKRGELGSLKFKIKDVIETARALSRLTIRLGVFLAESGLFPTKYVRALRPPPIEARTLGHRT